MKMNIKRDWPLIILIAMLSVSGFLLALYSPQASPSDFRFGAGAGIGTCGGQAAEYDNHMCDYSYVTKFFIVGEKDLTENVTFEVELYHLSHPEHADFHRSEFDERSSQLNGITANVIYWF